MLKNILLGFLNYGPMTGYDLKSLMESSTMHFWHAYHSQIYTTLRKMEEEHLVESELEDGDHPLNKRVYCITPQGRAALQAWLQTAMVETSQVKEELLVRVFFSGDRDRRDVLAELEVQRQLHQRQLDTYLALRHAPLSLADVPADLLERHGVFWAATLRFGIEYERLYLKWLDETIQMFQS
jgi:DNA-binding PadR family transcriptional regulator